MTTRISDERLRAIQTRDSDGPDIASALTELIERRSAPPPCWYCEAAAGEVECQRPFEDDPCRRSVAPPGDEAAAPVDGDSRVYQDDGEPQGGLSAADEPQATPEARIDLAFKEFSAARPRLGDLGAFRIAAWYILHLSKVRPEAPAVPAGWRLAVTFDDDMAWLEISGPGTPRFVVSTARWMSDGTDEGVTERDASKGLARLRAALAAAPTAPAVAVPPLLTPEQRAALLDEYSYHVNFQNYGAEDTLILEVEAAVRKQFVGRGEE